jgi:hypothetical protein
MLFKFKQKFLKISVELQTALAAEAQSAEEKCLKEQLNLKKLVTFRAGTRISSVSSVERQYFEP